MILNNTIMNYLSEYKLYDIFLKFVHLKIGILLESLPNLDLPSILLNDLQSQLEEQGYVTDPNIKMMNYSSFTSLAMIKEINSIIGTKESIFTDIIYQHLFNKITPINPSNWLKKALLKGHKTSINSEKTLAELLISPILIEILDACAETFSLFSGERFEVGKSYGLTGECDFLFSATPRTAFIAAPVFALVEAKKRSLEEGLAQCAAQMIAVREFNKKEDKNIKTIFGCVSHGEAWLFLKFENQHLTVDQEKFYLKNELELILGILHFIVNSTIQSP